MRLLRSLHSLAIVDVKQFEDSFLDFKWAFKKLPKSIPEALKKDLGLWLDQIFLAEGIDLIIPNFLSALDFCFFVSRQRKKKIKTRSPIETFEDEGS